MPVEEIDPRVELPPWIPLMAHITLVLLVPETVAENCWLFPPVTVADVGLTDTETAVGAATIETAALADFVGSAALVALTFTEEPEGTAPGAV